MADYAPQQARHYARQPNFGPSSARERDAAFNSIFGAAPSGRSQTMTSQPQTLPPTRSPQPMPPHASGMTPRAPPVRQGLSTAPPPQQPPPSNFSQPLPQPQQPPPPSQSQQPNGHVPMHQPMHYQQQPQPRNLPPPVYPDRRPLPPQRVDPTTAVPSQSQYGRPIPQRYPPGPGPSPAMNSNGLRTQSLVSNPRPPPSFAGAGSGINVPPAQAFRQQPYQNQLARTTAQGRVVPERHDERSMSMTSFARDNDYSQTMSGRVIPTRRRESSTTSPQELPANEFRQGPIPYGPAASAPPPASVPAPATAPAPAPAPNQSPAQSQSQRQPPPPNGHRPRASSQDSQSLRTMSMASTAAPSERTDSLSVSQMSAATTAKSNGQLTPHDSRSYPRRRSPLVYPALLSRVADAFRERIGLADREKDGLVYKSAFTGAEAVELIAYIMQTTDRNLALLLGRSLDAQKFFHDVTYDHRLRDSATEIYQFKETLVEEGADVNGIFTLTTECYSPTCTPDRLCYSIACPKRVDQQKRLNMKAQPGLKREESHTSLHEDDQQDEQKLWINTVSKEVAESVTDREKKRQEVIMELAYTERDFVKDLEYLWDFWMKPLRASAPGRPSIIPEQRREKFVRTVFSNCQDIYGVNVKLAEALTRRQQQEPVVRNVGDVMLQFVPKFTPFVKYGANQLHGKYEFEREKQANPIFARFADETERLKESRKLELNGYLTKPTTRLARYPLLLENILKYTADDNPDKEDLPKAIQAIREVLTEVNVASGKAENAFTLMQLSQQLVWRPGEYVDLKLTEEGRSMLLKGVFKKTPTENVGDIEAYLFDNALLFVRKKTVNKREELKVYKRPIPLGLLIIAQMEELAPKGRLAQRPSSSLLPGGRSATMTGTPKPETAKQQGYPLTFKHLGKAGFEQTLYASSQIMREKWMKTVEEQKDALRQRSNIFTKTILNEGFFATSGMKVNCCVPIDGGRKLVVGTDVGVYVTDRRPKDASIKPKRLLDIKTVTQVDVLEQHSILLVLSDKNLYSYSTDALESEEGPLGPSKRGKKISSASFFKVGVIDGQHLVCCVKTTSLSATIKVYRPMDAQPANKKKSGISRMLAGGQDVLRPYKEFYIPTETYSIHFLRRTLCVGCARGFEIVLLDTLVTQPLLDQADTSLDFVARKENLKPIHVERLNPNFLLCYSDFSFFVDKHGWRAISDWKIEWEGNPQAFALFQPYILAFEPSFIEIRHMDTGMLVYILTAKNVRMLHSSTREILYAYEDEMGEDVIASLDFWTGQTNGTSVASSSSTRQ